VSSSRTRWGAASVLVALGWLVTPQPVPVYDGVGAPDEPYRYVSPPAGAKSTPAPTSAAASTPVSAGASTNGLSLTSAETGPQVALFLPAAALGAPSGTIAVAVRPSAPARQPADGTIDGNVYTLTATDPAGPVALTSKAALATIYLRATTAEQPGPAMEHRSGEGQPWQAIKTSRGGADVYVSSLPATGQYALVFRRAAAGGSAGGGAPVLPLVLGGAVVLLGAVVVVVRVRSRSAPPAG